jgi:ribonuclease P/MRP protein subunit RPP40
MFNWIMEFLRDRKMRVGIQGSFSEWADVLSGVPQGSVFGLVLFLVFVNDLLDGVTDGIKMFADDAKIWKPIVKIEDKEVLEEDLSKLVAWSEEWLLKFNTDISVR